MDSGFIAAMTAYCTCRTCDQLLAATDDENKPSIWKYWGGYKILRVADNVAEAWEEVTESCLNRVWRKLWPELMQYSHGYKDVTPTVDCDTLNFELENENIEGICLHPMPKS
jgi:hypothetical protein